MAGKIVDISGLEFGRLLVVSFSHICKNGSSVWNCKCKCGKTSKVLKGSLKNGLTKSCGCILLEYQKTMSTTHGASVGGKKSPEYSAWQDMKARCKNPNLPNYKHYGGRGITVCRRWEKSFENFLKDIGVRPSKKHSLGRFPNVNGNYAPANCRWETREEQHRCRRDNRWIKFMGERLIISDWAKRFGTRPSTLVNSLKRKTFKQVYEYYTNR